MAYRRTLFSRFELANGAYRNATVTFYKVDANNEQSSELAPIYELSAGGDALANPYTLDGQGRASEHIYIEEPVIAVIGTSEVTSHDTGIYYPEAGDYVGTWETATTYYPGEIIQDGANGANTTNLYACTTEHTSGVWNDDLAVPYWDLVVDVSIIAGYATSASNSATAAAASETAAATSATAAASSATAAASSASAASTSETNAGNSATAAASSESNASTSETNAGNSATAAASSATAAASSATAAAASETAAGTSETNAGTSATNAASSASAASTSESNASTSETNAGNSETAAAASESAASTSETNAGNSATAAASSASGASSSATAASASAASAAGYADVIGFRWNFDSATTMADPGTSDFRLNNAALGSATAIAISATCANSGTPDVSDFINAWDDSTSSVRGHLIIKDIDNLGNFAVYAVSGSVTDNTAWLQMTLNHVTSSGSFTNTDECVVQFYRTGDSGSLIGIDGLTDVAIDGTPADHEMLVFDTASGEWINMTKAEAGFGALAELATVGTDEIDAEAVTYEKMQNVSDTDKILGRSTAGAGDVEEIDCTAAGRALIDDADAAAQRATLGVDTIWIGTFIEAPVDGDYKLHDSFPFAGNIKNVRSICSTGTATATSKINTTALGGTANSVSTSAQVQAHASANSISVGDDIVATLSSVSGAENIYISYEVELT